MDRNGTGFIYLFIASEIASILPCLPAVGHQWTVVCCGEAPACLFACGGDKQRGWGRVGRRTVGFGIPCIPAEEHTCPEPDINQLSQEQRKGFGL